MTLDVANEAQRLDDAERSRTQIIPTTELFPETTIEDAYRIQAAWQDIKEARGEKLVGHKIGLTSRAMQMAMKIETPDSGFITDKMVFEANSQIPAADHLDPKIEVELAFVLGADLDATTVTADGFGIETVLDATEHVVPALELIAARSFRRNPETGRTRTVVDTISDNAANAGIITGGNKIGPREADLRWVGALLSRNGVIEETGLAAGVLGHPAAGIVWLAKRYVEHDMALKAGQTVLAGSFTRPIDVSAGDSIAADYGPLGAFTVDFV